MDPRFDVTVVGAGPAGTSASIYLARGGRRVLLLDKARFPRPKACGEGIMPCGIPVLRDLGVLDPIEKKGRRFHGIEFTSHRGATVAGAFPEARYGLAIPRETLDSLLLEKAREEPNIEIRESHKAGTPIFDRDTKRLSGLAVEQVFRDSTSLLHTVFSPRCLIADGSSSQVTTGLGLVRRFPRRRRYGMSARFSGVEGLKEAVEVFFLEGGEIYLSPQAGEKKALIAVLVEEDLLKARFASRTEEGFFDMVTACPPLAERMERAVRETPILGAGPLGGGTRPWKGDGWWLVGDAASRLDPITGEGISLALHNGRLAAEQILKGDGGRLSYWLRRRRLFWEKDLLARFLLSASSSPSAADFTVRQMARHPGLLRWFLAAC